MYLVSSTRPDLSYSKGFLSRFMENPDPRQEALRRVHNLKYSRDMMLNYKALSPSTKRDAPSLRQGLIDVDWGGDRDTSKFVFTFYGSAITCSTKKQVTMALSSTEAEYIVATLVAKEGLWLQSIFSELDIIHITEFRLWCDNQSCIKISRNPKITYQNKHIRAQYHFLCELFDGVLKNWLSSHSYHVG